MRAFLTRFSACDPDMRPGIRWWLPGAKLDDRELIRELEDMHGLESAQWSFPARIRTETVGAALSGFLILRSSCGKPGNGT